MSCDIQGYMQYIQGLEDIVPDRYDGSYELVRETVKSYSTMNDYSSLDFRDLNLVYLMAVGTWKHSIDKKKDTVNTSHLPDIEKNRLIRVLDSVWEKANSLEYKHSEVDQGTISVGMFGTGFYSFQNKTTHECVVNFISMAVDIETMSDPDAIFDRAEQVLSQDFKGMGAASASIVLHCLKPTVFPILNGNMGYENIFEVLGVKLKKKYSVEKYIYNARLIREFRDKNFEFKNYRVLDIASRVMENYSDNIEYRIDEDKLSKELEIYKKEFERISKEELYKWKAVKCFQDNFNIEATDFPGMLEKALEKSQNLLTRNMYYAKGVILEIANYNPEYTREMFKNLFNEDEPVLNRIKQFEEDAEIYFQLKTADSAAKNHYQDAKASTVYLFFRYPEKYYIYLSMKFEYAAKLIGYKNIPKNGSMERVQAYFDMCNQIYAFIQNDTELLKMSQSRITDNCYDDPNNHMLAEDIAFFLNRQYQEEQVHEVAEEGFGPSLDEYDPGITAEEYEKVFSNPNIVRRQWLDTVYSVYRYGGAATCKQLSANYGNTPQHYYSNAIMLARKVIQNTKCNSYVGEDGTESYWPVLFFGKLLSGSENTYSWKLRGPAEKAIKSLEGKGFFNKMEYKTDYPKNIILYGPPGTGKTYYTTIYSVAIIEGRSIEEVSLEARNNYRAIKERYDSYLSKKQISFTTFHQSYGYEEFIEGIKPLIDTDEQGSGDIRYVIEKGVFASFCEQATSMSKAQDDYGFNKSPVIWKVSLGGTGSNSCRSECLENDHIRIGWDIYGPEVTDETNYSGGGRFVLNAFINKMRVGDIVLSCYSASTIDAIGVVTGEYEWHDEYDEYKRLRTVKWIVKDINYNIVDLNNGMTMTLAAVYKLNVSLSDILSIIKEIGGNNRRPITDEDDRRFVFIIDEINRGNIAKVFGELITLIEPTKRIGQDEELTLTLPYSKKSFGVPDNVFILGTMNTADRSIALMDTALRRRFNFIEMLPDWEVLSDIDEIEGIDIATMLRMMNKRIELLIDREHMIGHSYFMKLKETPTLDCLSEIFRNNIIPLLQEYFFDDYEKIRLILGDNQKADVETQFITRQNYEPSDYFGDSENIDEMSSYVIHEDVFSTKPEAYIGIYKQ